MIGRIYKIQHLDSSLCYIGSTCNTIRDRWRMHKKRYGVWIKNKDKYVTISLYPYLEQYGEDRFQTLLVKEYQVADKNQLRVYEQLAINRTKSCCNQNAALQLINTISMAKHYRHTHKDEISNRMKEYYQANKQGRSHRAKEYYQANKDAICNRVKEYGATRVMCECGTESSKNNITAHRKTAKHARLLAALNAPTQ